MILKRTMFSLLGMILTFMGIISCKDDFSEGDLVKQQNQAKLDELKSLSAKDSLDFLLAMEELEYKKYLDSLARADSIAIASGGPAYLPYTYEVQVHNGSTSSVSNGRTKAFDSDVTVTITQYGVKQTQTSGDGLFTFKNIGVGAIHGTITADGYTPFEWVVDASLPYQIFQDFAEELDGETGPYLGNDYYLDAIFKYFNQRSFSNDFPIFATDGTSTSKITGRAFIETNLTNRAKEVVPEGTLLTASLDVEDAAFKSRYLIDASAGTPTNDPDEISLNSIFSPTSWAFEFLGTAATDANGDYTLTVPASPDGLPIRIEYSDVIADKTYFIENNGDVTQITRRNIYGNGVFYNDIPNITLAPTVTFFAGGGATATATVSGDGSITDIDLVNGGHDFQGTPRVWIEPPPAGGTQATATATVVNGRVTEITLTDGGSGYMVTPDITITEGSGAEADVDSYVFNTTNGGVAEVIVTNSGLGYEGVPPKVVFYADFDDDDTYDVGEELTIENFPNGVDNLGFQSGTDFPSATAVFNSGSLVGVSTINVTNSGSLMNFAPKVLITSGRDAAATVTITGGEVTAVTITDVGRFYTKAPDITIPAAAGSGTTEAILTATITNDTLASIAITDAGAGYTDGTYALTVTSVGDGATADVVWEGMGIGALSVSDAGDEQDDGKYYTNPPLVVFPEPDYKGAGSRRAAGVAILGQDGRLVGVDITDEGSGYFNDGTSPVIELISGSGAIANAAFAKVGVTEVEVTNTGDGYLAPPQVLLVDPTGAGTGAAAVANIENGKLTSIELTDAGSGYINGASVIILDPGTSYRFNDVLDQYEVYENKAKANVIVENGVITNVEVYQNGDNYPAGTEIRINAIKGNGFAATPTVVNGEIAEVVVGSGGSGYVGNNYARSIGSAVNPNADVVGIPLPGKIDFSAPATFNAKSGITKVQDIEYGTGLNKD